MSSNLSNATSARSSLKSEAVLVRTHHDKLVRLRRANVVLYWSDRIVQKGLNWIPTNLLRAIAWLLIVLISVLSVVPPSRRPSISDDAHNFEHLAIFMLTGLAFGLGYRFRHLSQAAGLIIFAGMIEIAQTWIPGRHARTGDFVIDAMSACIGVLMAWLIIKVMVTNRDFLKQNDIAPGV
jgi:VanZ family protein